MKKLLVASTLALAAFGAAHAADGIKPLLGVGITFGGETIATVPFSDGSTERISSGGLIALYGGVEFKVAPQIALQTTVGYHVDDTQAASNGSLRFSRYPLDLLALYSVNDRVRLGVGVQHVSSPKLAGSGVAKNINVAFESSTGVILEAEYLLTPQIGLKARGVSHQLKVKGGSGEIDGDHFGLMLNYYF